METYYFPHSIAVGTGGCCCGGCPASAMCFWGALRNPILFQIGQETFSGAGGDATGALIAYLNPINYFAAYGHASAALVWDAVHAIYTGSISLPAIGGTTPDPLVVNIEVQCGPDPTYEGEPCPPPLYHVRMTSVASGMVIYDQDFDPIPPGPAGPFLTNQDPYPDSTPYYAIGGGITALLSDAGVDGYAGDVFWRFLGANMYLRPGP